MNWLDDEASVDDGDAAEFGWVDGDLSLVRAPIPPTGDEVIPPLFDEHGNLTNAGDEFLTERQSEYALGGDYDAAAAAAWHDLEQIESRRRPAVQMCISPRASRDPPARSSRTRSCTQPQSAAVEQRSLARSTTTT